MTVRSRWWGLLSLVAGTSLLRAASVFSAPGASWDEDTFILVAQRLSLGELPFTTTFENKPPLFSVLLAVPQFVAPDSRMAVRLTLAAVVLLSALAIRAVVRRATGSLVAGDVAGLVLVSASALAPAGQAWMSQQSANLWLAVLLLLLIGGERSGPVRFELVGIAAAVLVLTRTNYAIPAAAVILLSVSRLTSSGRSRALVRLAVGGAIPAGAVLVAYGLAGELPALLAGVFEILVVDGGQGDLRAGLRLPPPWLVSTSGLLVALGAVAWPRGESGEDGARRLWWACALLTVFMGVSVLLHQSIFTHYLLMFTVPFAVLGGLAAHAILRHLRDCQRPGPASRRSLGIASVRVVVLLLTAAALVPSVGFDPSRLVPDDDGIEQMLQHDVVSAVEELLGDRPGPVWALTDHYVYWRTGTLPPHPLVTHPSSLVKPEFWAAVPMDDAARPTSPRAAVNLILATEPRYVIATEQLDEWYLDRLPPEDRAHLVGHLERRYRIVWRSGDDIVIRERRPPG